MIYPDIVTDSDGSRRFNTDGLAAEIVLHESAVRENQEKVQRITRIRNILDRLPGSWRQPDPGKYGAAYYFVDGGNNPVVLRDLLPEGTRVFGPNEQGAWQEYAKALPHLRLYDAVPPRLAVVDSAALKREQCPACQKTSPVIMSYDQTDDSMDGDTWTRQFLIICCAAVRVLESESSGYRMM